MQYEYSRISTLSGASLLVIDCRCKPKVYPLKGRMTFGRIYDGELCDITVLSAIVGRRHGEFVQNEEDGAYYYIDNNSVNGTFINGYKLENDSLHRSRAARLADGDILRVDRSSSEKPHHEAVIMVFCGNMRYDGHWRVFDSGKLINITIGSGENNVIRLSYPAAAPSHAVLRRTQKSWAIFDNGLGGVRVNGRRINGNAHVNDHDVITVGDTTFVIYGNILLYITVSPC